MTARQLLDTSIKEIRTKIDQHEQLLEHIEDGTELRVQNCVQLNGRYGQRIREALVEAIEVLENSRKAFKSKELETLRKKLIKVLADCT
jgi:hypothetical protein